MNASLQPSSRIDGLKYLPARDPSSLHTDSEPVTFAQTTDG